MGSPSGSFVGRALAWLKSPWPAAVLGTVVTLAVVGVVFVAATTPGCQLARGAGININSARCQTANQAAVITSASPLQPSPTALPTPSPVPSPSAIPSPSPVPQTVPHDPSLPPYEFDTGASGAYPPTFPFYPVAAGAEGSTAPLQFSCRLPISAGGSGSGGFIAFPDGNFIADPRSAVTITPPADYTPPAGGYGPGPTFFGLSYDKGAGRWVPVPWAWITPDGKRYAFTLYGAEGIYVVDVATKAQTEIGDGHKWNLLDVEQEGVYATDQAGGPGLWLVPFSGAVRQLTAMGYWQAVGGGAAYGTPTSAVPNGVANVIIRLDLKTSGATPKSWFEVADTQVNVFGFDPQGHPLMSIRALGSYQQFAEIWDVYGVGQAEALFENQNFSSPISDIHGVWISSSNGIWLWVPGQAMVLVSTIGGQLAGSCV